MRYLLALILVAPLAWGDNGHGHNDAGSAEGGAATSDSWAGAAAGAGSLSGAVVTNNISVHGSGDAAGDSIDMSVNHKVDTVASTPGTINSNHICASAFAGQSKLVGFSTAQVDYVCMISRVIQADGTHAARLRAKGDTASLAAAELMDAEIAQRVKELNQWIRWKWWTVRIFTVLKIALMVGVTKTPF